MIGRTELERRIGVNKVAVVSDEGTFVGMSHWKRIITMSMNSIVYDVVQRQTPRIIRSPRMEYSLPLVVGINCEIFTREVSEDDIVGFNFIRERDNYTCQYCGEYGYTIDHIYPKSKGGPNTMSNLCVACKTCNEAKADTLLEELGWKRPNINLDFIYNGAYIEKNLAHSVEMLVQNR